MALGAAPSGPWGRALLGAPAACAVLALLWVALVASLARKSPTYDEVAHAAAGYSYWHFGDYRLQPENGQLPQRLAGLPMALAVSPLPAPEPSAWRDSDDWLLGYLWLFKSGRDADALVLWGRMCCALFAVAVGALVWAWARRRFGPAGAMVSLVLYAASPAVLANGALMTSDMAAALFILASAGSLWAVLGRVTPARVAVSSLVLAGLFLTKVSALLVLPVAAVLAAVRVADGRPLEVRAWRRGRVLVRRTHQAAAVAALVVLHAAAVVAVLWASYGFRYSAFADSAGRFRQPWEYLLAKPGPAAALGSLHLTQEQRARVGSILVARGASEAIWSNPTLDALSDIRRDVLTPEQAAALDAVLSRPSPEAWVRVVEAARRHHLLPEAWIYGFTDVYRRSQVRPAFMNGEFRLQGWRSFFPYAFLVKTPLGLFAVMGLAALAYGRGARPGRAAWERLYALSPLWTLVAVYAAAAVASHLNIGHRHLLPVYPPLFILCGAAGAWLPVPQAPSEAAGRWARALGLCLALCLTALVAEAIAFFPNYLAYFNGIVSPRTAYRHLVDSSLDWGQDLPAVRSYLDRHPDQAGSAYFSYFGTASPDYYGIRARHLFSVAGLDARDRGDWRNVFVPADEAGERIPALRQELADYDLLGAQRLGELVAAVFLKKPSELALHPGTYLVSASMLQPVNFDLQGPWGPWNRRYEDTYRELSAVRPLMSEDPAERIAALRSRRVGDWPLLLDRFEAYRFGRLTAYLRHREPDEEINFSVLVYHLSATDLDLALEGPPPELGPDAVLAEKAKLPPSGADALP